MPNLLSQDGHNWFLHSFLLKTFRYTLPTLGNYSPYLMYAKLVQISKALLDRTLGKITYDKNQLQTVIYECLHVVVGTVATVGQNRPD